MDGSIKRSHDLAFMKKKRNVTDIPLSMDNRVSRRAHLKPVLVSKASRSRLIINTFDFWLQMSPLRKPSRGDDEI